MHWISRKTVSFLRDSYYCHLTIQWEINCRVEMVTVKDVVQSNLA